MNNQPNDTQWSNPDEELDSILAEFGGPVPELDLDRAAQQDDAAPEEVLPVAEAADPGLTQEADEEDEDEDDEPPKKRHPVLRGILAVLLSVVLLLSLAVLGADQWLQYQFNRGRSQLLTDFSTAQIALPEDDERIVTEDAGKTLTYNGVRYRQNENLTTVLLLGVDRADLNEVETQGSAGQADVILLIAEDTETGEIKILHINRDTEAEMMVYSGSGKPIGYQKHQICVAYSYGNRRELSCENTLATVSKLLYGMPISKYIAIDMEGVIEANETIGGVTLTSLEDLSMPDGTDVKAGDVITLHDQNCDHYLRQRTHDLEGNNVRMLRQKQYIQEFAGTTIRQARSDFSIISKLYQTIMPYIVTDTDLSDVIFLAETFLLHRNNIQMLGLEGTMDWVLNIHGYKVAIMYPDEDNLFETMLDVYYQAID